MSVHPRVVHKRRETITALPLYFSGQLLKKQNKEKDFKKYYGELRGATLFLYKDETQDTYAEKLDLEEVKSMELESPYQKKTPTIFTLTLRSEAMQLKMDNPDTGEEWRGYILTVIKKEIPRKLQLLPGQMLKLQEVLNQEMGRNPPAPRPPLPPRPSFLKSPSSPTSRDEHDHNEPEIPTCFFTVTRQEAEQMLEANPEYGSIILRPSTLPKNYAVTIRQLTPSGPAMKNYRVTSTKSGFVIDLETPVTAPTLNDVLKYFLEKTEYRLQPYMACQPYDTRIDAAPVPKSINITSPTPKTVPQAQVAPMMRSQTKEEPVAPPTKEVESEYIYPDDHRTDEQTAKQVQLDEELREILKLRREMIYSETNQEEDGVYVNQTDAKANSGTAPWTAKASVA